MTLRLRSFMLLPRMAVGVLVLLAAFGCAEQQGPESAASGEDPAPAAPAVPTDPAASYQQMESALLAADEVQFSYHITSEGMFAADLRGDVVISAGGRADITGTGTFGRDSVNVMLRSDGTTMAFGRKGETLELLAPAFLQEALIVGITRMGLLHNLARLVAAAPPDRAEGGVEDWVRVGAFSADPAGVAFDITVEGQPAGAAKLSLDGDGLPRIRRQLVSFPEGQMRVTERYTKMTVR